MKHTYRIAYFTTTYPSVSHTFIRRELMELEKRGHEILRIALRPAGASVVDPVDMEEQRKTVYCLRQRIHAYVFSVLRCALLRPYRFFNALLLTIGMGRQSEKGLVRHIAYLIEACMLLTLLYQYSIEHVHVHFGTNVTTVARLCHRLGGPEYSFTVHGPGEFDAPKGFDLSGKVVDAAFVVGISSYAVAQLQRWTRPADWKKINLIHCTVDDSFFAMSSSVKEDVRRFVCLGRLTPQKGQLTLVDSFARIIAAGADAQLVFVGDGELRSDIEDRIALHGLNDRIFISGYVAEAQVRHYIASSRVVVLPSYAEGLPLAIIESFAVGRPVISTYVAGIPELVCAGENGWLVPAGDIQALAYAMLEALNTNIVKIEDMARCGRQRVSTSHYTPIEVDRLEQLFKEHIERHTVPAELHPQSSIVQ